MLNGKRFLFLGNSLTYYGQTVRNQDGRPTQEEGIFAKLARHYGQEVAVTNFTFGGAGFLDGRKKPEVDGMKAPEYGLYQLLQAYHPGYAGNPQGLPLDGIYRQDYVVLQQRGADLADTDAQGLQLASLFPQGTKFVVLLTHQDAKHPQGQASLHRLAAALQAPVVDWGNLVQDIWQGKHRKELSCTYHRQDFVLTKDNLHPSFLAGYFTSLMLFCTLTRQSPVGAPWDFVRTDTEGYLSPSDTQAPQILADEEEMAALQKCMAAHLGFVSV